MKTIGILGGMPAASTQLYDQELCRLTQVRLGGLHSPDLLIRSLDFTPIEALQIQGDWDQAGQILNYEARALKRGRAEMLILATNTMHKLVQPMMQGVSIPLLHIADATAGAIVAAGKSRPGLMATAFTMGQSFYTNALRAVDLVPVVPEQSDRDSTHRIIYEELCKGVVMEESRQAYVNIAGRLAENGADSLILGCTEVRMLLDQDNVDMPVFDTTLIHCAAALDLAMQGQGTS